jgi:hypothetical protein
LNDAHVRAIVQIALRHAQEMYRDLDIREIQVADAG